MIYRVGRVRLKTEETYHGFGIMCVDCGLWTVDTTDSCISKGIGIGIVTNMKQEKNIYYDSDRKQLIKDAIMSGII